MKDFERTLFSNLFRSNADIRVAMLCDNEFVMDSRIYREATTLVKAGYQLTLFAVKRNDLPESEIIDGIQVKRIFDQRLFHFINSNSYLKEVAVHIKNYNPHILHCHDWIMLHLGVIIKKQLPKTILIYDSHELFHSWPRHYSSLSLDIVVKSWIVRKLEVLREWIDRKHIDYIITVSQSIADHLNKYLNAKNRVALIRNFAEFEEITVREDFVRNKFNIPVTDKVIVLFAYLIYRKKRNIEQVIDEIGNRPGVSFVIFCKNGGHKNYFMSLIKDKGFTNIYFHEAIPADKIVNYLASCDVGIIPTWNKKHLSYWLGLENKLFHYIMSELPILASAQPEHKNIIEGHKLGVCVNADQQGAYWYGLKELLKNIDQYKKNVASSKRLFSWDTEKTHLLNLYNRIITEQFSAYEPISKPLGIQSINFNNTSFKECVRCVFNNDIDRDIYFNESGLCNHCVAYDSFISKRIIKDEDKSRELELLINNIKKAGKGKKYDCIIGVSGGLDSTYVAYLVKQYGLRPLAVHCDNGWNSEQAVKNIERIISGLGIDLYTHVINWEEFRDIQLSYLKASVVDVEAPSDHAIFASMYHVAKKYGIKYILSGESSATEGILPESWNYLKFDLINIKGIQGRFGTKRLETFPKLGYARRLYYKKIINIKYVKFLDYVNYIKTEAKKTVTEVLGWQDYGGKHYESIITRFYQSYILPQKFNIDKRYSHFSTLICNGQLSKDEAKRLLSLPIIEERLAIEDRKYIIKKFGLSDDEFENIMNAPIKKHTDYPSFIGLIRKYRPLINLIKYIARRRNSGVYEIKRKNCVAVLISDVDLNNPDTIKEIQIINSLTSVLIISTREKSRPDEDTIQGLFVKRIFENGFDKQIKINLYSDIIARMGFEAIHCFGPEMIQIGIRVKQLNKSVTLTYDITGFNHNKIDTKSASKDQEDDYISPLMKRNYKKNVDYLILLDSSFSKINSSTIVLNKRPLCLSLNNSQDSFDLINWDKSAIKLLTLYNNIFSRP